MKDNIRAIFILAGHGTKNGNIDNGASNNGLVERDLVKTISKNLFIKLISNDIDIDLILIGYDEDLSINEKVKKVNDICEENLYTYKNSLLIEFHCNATGEDNVGTGTEVLIWDGDKESEKFGNILIENTTKLNGLKNRGIKDGLWAGIVRETAPRSVLFETAFINTKEDRKVLTGNIESFSNGIYNGLKEYIGFEDILIVSPDIAKEKIDSLNKENKELKEENNILKEKLDKIILEAKY